jgi:hypothetical protein
MTKQRNSWLSPIYWLGVLYARFNYKLNLHRFRSECQRAESLSAQNNGQRYRVFKVSKNKYQSLSGNNIRLLKNRKIIKTKLDMGLLSKNCLYDTLTHTNLHPAYLNADLKLKDANGKLIKQAKPEPEKKEDK